jgi:hypothetical protein
MGGLNPGPGVFAIATVNIVGEKIDAITAARGEIVDSANDTFAEVILPCGVTSIPVADVGRIVVEVVHKARSWLATKIGCVVKSEIAEEILGTIGAAFEKILPAAFKLEVMFASILESAKGAEIWGRFVGGSYPKGAGFAIKRGGTTSIGVDGDIDALACAKRGTVAPSAGFIGGKVGAPFVAGASGGIGRIAVGGEVSGDGDGFSRQRGEAKVEAIVKKRIRRGGFAGARS